MIKGVFMQQNIAFFQNSVTQVLVIPIILALISAFFSLLPELARGVSIGGKNYRLWVKQQGRGSGSLSPVSQQSLGDIRRNFLTINTINDIEQLVRVEFCEFAYVGLDLIIGAFTIDLILLIKNSTAAAYVGARFILHLIFLSMIICLLIIRNYKSSDQNKDKTKLTLFAIILGVVAIAISFWPQ